MFDLLTICHQQSTPASFRNGQKSSEYVADIRLERFRGCCFEVCAGEDERVEGAGDGEYEWVGADGGAEAGVCVVLLDRGPERAKCPGSRLTDRVSEWR